jgi:hypothetical protein
MRFHSNVDNEDDYQNTFCLLNAMFSSLLKAQTNRTTNSLASLLDGRAIVLKDFHHKVMSICELDACVASSFPASGRACRMLSSTGIEKRKGIYGTPDIATRTDAGESVFVPMSSMKTVPDSIGQ